MARDDQIQVATRQDRRTLETERASFAIARKSLLSAPRLVQSWHDRQLFLQKDEGTTASLDVLNALSSLLSAKQILISSWISYETTRVQLLLDMEALQLDDRGIATDERDHESADADCPSPPPGTGRTAAADRDRQPAGTPASPADVPVRL